jgi:chromosome segregation ATPase
VLIGAGGIALAAEMRARKSERETSRCADEIESWWQRNSKLEDDNRACLLDFGLANASLGVCEKELTARERANKMCSLNLSHINAVLDDCRVGRERAESRVDSMIKGTELLGCQKSLQNVTGTNWLLSNELRGFRAFVREAAEVHKQLLNANYTNTERIGQLMVEVANLREKEEALEKEKKDLSDKLSKRDTEIEESRKNVESLEAKVSEGENRAASYRNASLTCIDTVAQLEKDVSSCGVNLEQKRGGLLSCEKNLEQREREVSQCEEEKGVERRSKKEVEMELEKFKDAYRRLRKAGKEANNRRLPKVFGDVIPIELMPNL